MLLNPVMENRVLVQLTSSCQKTPTAMVPPAMERAMVKIHVMATANVWTTFCQLQQFAVLPRMLVTPMINVLAPAVSVQPMCSRRKELHVPEPATTTLAMLLIHATAQVNVWIDSCQALRSAVALKMPVMHLKCVRVPPVTVPPMFTSWTSPTASLARKPVTVLCRRILAKKPLASMASVPMSTKLLVRHASAVRKAATAMLKIRAMATVNVLTTSNQVVLCAVTQLRTVT